MALNNFLWMSIWWVLLTRFEQIRGYRLAGMTALFGLCALCFGLAMVLFGGPGLVPADRADQAAESDRRCADTRSRVGLRRVRMVGVPARPPPLHER
jgi:hypothetical protein